MPWLSLPLLASACCQLSAAELTFSLTASATNYELGSGFAVAGDLNGDGVLDIAVADRSARVAGFTASGAVQIVSGVDGALLRTYSGTPAASQNFGAAVVALDADGDAIPDLAIGSPGQSSGGSFGAGGLRIYAGATGELLTAVVGQPGSQLGVALANAGDQNGDGIDDLYAGAPNANGSRGCVFVISGANGETLRTITTDASTSSFGVSLVALGDSDGDGLADVAVGAPAFRSTTAYQAGQVLLVRSSNNAPVATLTGSALYNRLGDSLAAVPDCNDDGLPDLVVGSYSGGTAWLVSGADFALLHDLSIPGLPLYRQLTVGGSVDFDGDGTPDWLLGSPGMATVNNQIVGAIRVVSGADGSTLYQYTATAPNTGLGTVLKVLPGYGFAAGEPNLRDLVTRGSGHAMVWQVDMDADGDGVPDAQDLVPHSIMDPTVQVGDVDSTVSNTVNTDGVTLADRFAQLGSIADYPVPALFYVEFQKLGKDLARAGIISTSENRLLAAAARQAALGPAR